MASSSGAEFKIDEDAGGQKSIIRASDPQATSEKQNPGMPDEEHHTTRASRSNLSRFFGRWPFCCAESSPKRSWYYSARIQRMIDGGELQSENVISRTESEIEASKVHWSEVVDTSATMSKTEQSGKTNREYFEVLKRRKYVRKGNQIVFEQIPEHEEFIRSGLFSDYWGEKLVVGEKLAEGGQAEIYAATSGVHVGFRMVVKMFKDGSVLQHLEKQIPPALLKYHQDKWGNRMPVGLFGATLLTDERFRDRFAFVMRRYWGDLRKLIDHQMMHSSLNAGPPFSTKQLLHLMWGIAYDMSGLHGQHQPILHNDLKAANVLVSIQWFGSRAVYSVAVADYECSVGVVGTGFWRAPEILQQLKDRVPMSDLKFSKKCDVYSYGMTCYELVTGRIPFEDCTSPSWEVCELVLNGGRPKLPPDLDPFVKGIITSCWHPNPSNRPSFKVISKKLRAALKGNRGKRILKWIFS